MWLGIDIGTSSVKTVLVDSIANSCSATLSPDRHDASPSQTQGTEEKDEIHGVISSAATPHSSHQVRCIAADLSSGNFCSNHSLHAEQSAASVLNSLSVSIVQCLNKALGTDPSQIRHIALCGQMHGVILWTKGTHIALQADETPRIFGNVSNLITWEDKRCSEEFLRTLPESLIPLASGYGCATLFWLKEKFPEYLSQFDYAGTIADFVACMLCADQPSPVISDHNAASWGYCDMERSEWQSEILTHVDFPVHLLPSIVKPGVKVGITADNCLCGLPSGIDVYAATGDTQCSIMSTRFNSTQAVLNMGTACQLSYMTPVDVTIPPDLPHITEWPYISDKHLVVAASINGGNVLASFINMLQSWVKDLGCEISEDIIWSRISQMTIESTADKITEIKPTLNKERATPDAHHSGASVTNILSDNISLSSVYQQLCLGLINNVHTMIPQEVLIYGGVAEILCTGSVFKQHPQIVASVRQIYDKMIVKVIDNVDAAYGAVLIAVKS